MTTTVDRITGVGGNLGIKAPVRAATTANITLSGTQTIDGVAIVADDRVLVKNQTTGADNGIYVAATSAWTRAADFDGNRDIVTGTVVSVNSGTTNAGILYSVSTTGTIIIGTTSLSFAQVGFSSGLGTMSTQNANAVAITGGSAIFTGTSSMSGKAFNEAQGATIVSATTTDIGAATGNYVIVSGTVTITGLGTVQAGTRRIVEFSGALILTHNASSLILPGGLNITTAAGDCGEFVSEGSGNWRCVNYTKASGKAVTQSVPYSCIAGLIPTAQTFTSATISSMTISAGQAADSTNTAMLTGGAFSWNITNGNAANGYEGGTTLPNSATIHFYIIGKSDLSAFASFASTSLMPTLPTGYTSGYYRRILSLKTNSSGVLPIAQGGAPTEGNGGSLIYFYNVSPLDISVTNLSTTVTSYALSVPTGIVVKPFYRYNMPTTSRAIALFCGVQEGVTALPAYSASGWTAAPGYDTAYDSGTTNFVTPRADGNLLTDTSGQIYAISNGASTALYLVTRGFEDFRR